MAGQTQFDLVTEIETLLPIWSGLYGKDQRMCKKLIDHKIGMLKDCAPQPYESSYAFLSTALNLRKKLSECGYDLVSVKEVITKEMEDLMVKNGLEESLVPKDALEVSGEAETVQPSAPLFEILICWTSGDIPTAISTSSTNYSLQFVEDYLGTGYRYVLSKNGKFKMDAGVVFSPEIRRRLDYEYPEDSNKIFFHNMRGKLELYLEFSSVEQANAFVEHSDRYSP